MIKIISYPQVVETPCQPVVKHPTEGYAELAPNVYEMIEFVRARNGLGLAAPQIGDFRTYFVVNYGPKPLVVLNSSVKLIKEAGFYKSIEGCYSCLGKMYWVSRARKIQLTYEDLFGRKQNVFLSGLLATIVQHEHDHIEQKCICMVGKENSH